MTAVSGPLQAKQEHSMNARSSLTPSTEERLRGSDHQTLEQDRTEQDDGYHRRLAASFDRLAGAVIASDSLDNLLGKLLAIFVEMGGADVGVIRLRNGGRLWSRVAIGLEQEVKEGFSVPVDEVFADEVAQNGAPRLVACSSQDPHVGSKFIEQQGVRQLHCLPLVDGAALIGAVYLGSRAPREISGEDQHLLGLVAARTSDAILRYQTQESLLHAVVSRDQMLSVVAHDLRNPINVIAIAANTLMQRLTDSSAKRTVERIVRGVQRADRLIRDLLEINAIETGRFTVETHRVEPADVILAALESQQSLVADASVIIATDMSPELPPIEADEERLLEVLENLIGNAVKFTKAGGSITVGAARRDSEVLLWVQDNGTGIAPDQLPHIFDRFWQAKKEERRGTGLGLTICKGIVEAHGGRIWAESTLGTGTTMYFTLPAMSPRAARDSDVVNVANILLVDDRPEYLLSLKAILERPDYRLVTAESGEEALSLALREHFSVALIDVAMPNMNGLEVATHMKELERSRDIPIIFITAFGDDPEEIHRAYSAGGVDYLVKPLDTEIVRKKVAVFVDLSRKRRVFDRPRTLPPRA
jgi:signal transduction histidine kinase/CheY-like chemotaxis protein